MLIEKTLERGIGRLHKRETSDGIMDKRMMAVWMFRLLSDILEQEENHFLVNVPAYHNPEFAQAVAEMVEQKGTDDCNREATPAGRTRRTEVPPPHRAGSVCDSGKKIKGEKALELKEGKGAAGDRAVDRCKILVPCIPG